MTLIISFHSNNFAGKSGPTGQTGTQGPSGPKGERGETPGVAGPAPQTSAFTVGRTSPQSGNNGDILLFTTTHSNIGADFNVATGKFTCRIPGIYSFSFHIMFVRESPNGQIQLQKNNQGIVSVYHDGDAQTYATESNGAILQLEVGDEVLLQFVDYHTGEVHDNVSHFTSFSGFLLQAM